MNQSLLYEVAEVAIGLERHVTFDVEIGAFTQKASEASLDKVWVMYSNLVPTGELGWLTRKH